VNHYMSSGEGTSGRSRIARWRLNGRSWPAQPVKIPNGYDLYQTDAIQVIKVHRRRRIGLVEGATIAGD
jgi:hypothetical protein